MIEFHKHQHFNHYLNAYLKIEEAPDRDHYHYRATIVVKESKDLTNFLPKRKKYHQFNFLDKEDRVLLSDRLTTLYIDLFFYLRLETHKADNNNCHFSNSICKWLSVQRPQGQEHWPRVIYHSDLTSFRHGLVADLMRRMGIKSRTFVWQTCVLPLSPLFIYKMYMNNEFV